MPEKRKSNAITLKGVTLSFPSLFKKAEFEGEETKYQTSLIIPKDSQAYKALKKNYDECVQEAMNSKKLTKNQVTPWFRTPGSTKGIVVDCDEDPDTYEDERYRGCVIATAKNGQRPVVCDAKRNPLTEDDNEIYGGCVCNVSVNCYCYSKTYKGISLQLNGVQKVKDGESFGAARLQADDMFDEEEYDDEDLYD